MKTPRGLKRSIRWRFPAPAVAADVARWVDPKMAEALGYGADIGAEAALVRRLADVAEGRVPDTYLGGIEASEGRWVGFTVLSLDPPNRKARLSEFYVTPQFQGTGVPAVAFHKMLAELFRAKVLRVEVEVLAQRKDLLSLLSRFGFESEGKLSMSRVVDGTPRHTVLLRMLRREFKEKAA